MKDVARALPALLAVTLATSACAGGHSGAGTTKSQAAHRYSVVEVERTFAAQGIHLHRAPALNPHDVHLPTGIHLSATNRRKLARLIKRESRNLVSLRAGRSPHLVAVTIETGPLVSSIRWILGSPLRDHEPVVTAARRNVIAFFDASNRTAVKAALADLP